MKSAIWQHWRGDAVRKEGGKAEKKGGNGHRLGGVGRPADAVTAITPNGASDRGQFNLSVYTAASSRVRPSDKTEPRERMGAWLRGVRPRDHAT